MKAWSRQEALDEPDNHFWRFLGEFSECFAGATDGAAAAYVPVYLGEVAACCVYDCRELRQRVAALVRWLLPPSVHAHEVRRRVTTSGSGRRTEQTRLEVTQHDR